MGNLHDNFVLLFLKENKESDQARITQKGNSSSRIYTLVFNRADSESLCSYLIRTTLTVWTPGILLYSDSSCRGKRKCLNKATNSQIFKSAGSDIWSTDVSNGRKTYRVHHCFRNFLILWREDVFEVRAVNHGVCEVDKSSVVNWRWREGRRKSNHTNKPGPQTHY